MCLNQGHNGDSSYRDQSSNFLVILSDPTTTPHTVTPIDTINIMSMLTPPLARFPAAEEKLN